MLARPLRMRQTCESRHKFVVHPHPDRSLSRWPSRCRKSATDQVAATCAHHQPGQIDVCDGVPPRPTNAQLCLARNLPGVGFQADRRGGKVVAQDSRGRQDHAVARRGAVAGGCRGAKRSTASAKTRRLNVVLKFWHTPDLTLSLFHFYIGTLEVLIWSLCATIQMLSCRRSKIVALMNDFAIMRAFVQTIYL